jgi:hypothetical protein
MATSLIRLEDVFCYLKKQKVFLQTLSRNGGLEIQVADLIFNKTDSIIAFFESVL